MPSTHLAEGQYELDGVPYMSYIPPEALEAVTNMAMRTEDVMLVTYPKAGTTWLSQLVCLLLEKDVQDIRKAVPIVEFAYPGKEPNAIYAEDAPSPRIISTHLQPQFFEKSLSKSSPKVIVLMRNPKDCLISYYHFYRANLALGQFKGEFSEFFDMHKDNTVVYGDVVQHMTKWWKAYEKDERFIFLTFEDMKSDPGNAVKVVSKFLGIELSQERVDEIVDKTSFAKMSKDPTVNKENARGQGIHDASVSKYMRKGVVGDWASTFTEEQSNYIDERCKAELEPIGLSVKFTIE